MCFVVVVVYFIFIYLFILEREKGKIACERRRISGCRFSPPAERSCHFMSHPSLTNGRGSWVSVWVRVDKILLIINYFIN